MRRWIVLTFVFLSAVSTLSSQSQDSQEQGMTLPEYIGQIAESEEIDANAFLGMASGTLQVAQAVSQSGQRLPDSVIEDALDALEAGRSLAPQLTDWNSLEQKLLELLEPPEQQQQNQQSQDGEQGDESEEQEGQSGDSSSQSGEQSGDPSQSQEQQQQGRDEQSQNQSQQSQSESENQPDASSSQNESASEENADGEPQQQPPAKDGAQMGELGDQEKQDVQLADSGQNEQSAPQEQMQTLGGQQTTGEPINAENAALRQMLEQLKQQDDPGKLFKILQDAREGEKRKSQPKTKDW